jgi:peptidoglycan/LPS O-acetylase OafA/YrhL
VEPELETKPRVQADAPVPEDDTATSDPGKQSRVAAGIPVVAAFDGYRAYAILAIVLLHVLGYSGVLPAAHGNWFAQLILGTFGQWVDVLFVVSGFVVFLPTVARGGEFGNVGSYAIRRAARLAPAYWAVLAIMLLLTGLVTIHPPIVFPSIGSIGAHATFMATTVQMFRDVPMGFAVDGPLWTLTLEVTFYVLLPFIAAWYFRRPLLGLAIAAVITAAWHEAIIHSSSVFDVIGHPSPTDTLRFVVAAHTQFPFFAFSFAAGMTGAWAYVRLRALDTAQSRRWIVLAQVVSLAGFVVFTYITGHNAARVRGFGIGDEEARRSSIVALGYTASLATLMVSTALGARRWQRPFAHPFARQLGDISYGIYLIHMVVLTYALRLLSLSDDGSIAAFLVMGAIVFPVTLAYAYVSARFLEQPIRRWAQRFGRRRSAAPAPARA